MHCVCLSRPVGSPGAISRLTTVARFNPSHKQGEGRGLAVAAVQHSTFEIRGGIRVDEV